MPTNTPLMPALRKIVPLPVLLLYNPPTEGGMFENDRRGSRIEISEWLLARVECARARYESSRSEAEALREIAGACLGNTDGTLAIQRHRSANQRANEAMIEYQHAIQDLNDFVLRGKVPADSK